jgi:predicted nucleic acid-binding protein
MNLLLDTGILGKLCHPNRRVNLPVEQWLESLLVSAIDRVRVIEPEIADYELRRKLLHLIRQQKASPKSISRLDDLGRLLDYLPLDTETMHRAAKLGAESRSLGTPTASEVAIDGDVILAAQALAVQGTIATANRKHLSRFVPAFDYAEITHDRLTDA